MQLASRPNPAPNILALDTSTEALAVALQRGGEPWHALSEGGMQASAKLLPQVAALLAQAGIAYADLDFIAFGRGPGAFTGLRTACAVAQGIALAIDKPVLPIDSLLIVAEDAREQLQAQTIDIAVAMDARMNEVYAGIYRHADGVWSALHEPALYSLPALSQAWAGLMVTAITGSALQAFAERLPQLPDAQRVPLEQDRAAALLRLAVQAAQHGAGIDAAQALPLYLRDKVAQTTAERAAIKAAAVQ